MPKPLRIFIAGDYSQDGAPGTVALAEFLENHPDALVLDENPFANISGYSSTVADEISLILEPLCLSQEDMMGRIETVAEQLNIFDLLERNPLALSGGQTQLVSLASLLVGEPRPLVLHSLLQGLDAAMRARVLAALESWDADVLWTNPAQPFDEELAFADQVIEPVQRITHEAQLQLEWQLQPETLITENLAISPEAIYPSRRKLFARRPRSPFPLHQGINLIFSPGDLAFLRGPNGAGKTTLFRTLAGIIEPVDGQVRMGQDVVTQLPPAERVKRVSLVGQHAQHRIISSTVEKDLLLGPAAEGEKYMRALADALGLGEALDAETHPHDLTLEQQTLLSIVNALLVMPSVLLLDEPTAHLSLPSIDRLQAVLESYRQAGGIVLCISHHQALASLPDAREINIAEIVA